jgi:fucose 4-O-acetylase-like acetyltransferase
LEVAKGYYFAASGYEVRAKEEASTSLYLKQKKAQTLIVPSDF